MARFRFRAQPALDLRRRELDAAERELAQAQGLLDAARSRAAQAAAAMAEATRRATERAREAGSITDWHWYRIWILRLEYEHRDQLASVARCETVVEAARIACATARQRYESLERLREKARQTFDRAEDDAERKLIDELATRRFLVGTREEGALS
jgi:flagellar export protein FliJ